ncbi:MAG: DUF2318 domain-containing protein [Deltaproteobacteria bacterium]|jgi:uncharacterized membrane protein|nr:DUF2318 domain-containing protein [Deltaproteobacteria bacterium]
MLHFLILVSETLLPVAMLLGALLGFAWQRRLFEVRTPAKYGAALGLAAAASLAGLKMGTGFIVREYYNLAVLLVTIPFELLLLAYLFRSRAMSSEKAASPLMRAMFFVVAAAWTAYYLPDIFIYPSHFAVGVVQVVSSEFVFIVVGYLTGLLLCALSCRAAYKVCADIPIKTLFPLLALLLLIFIVQQAVVVGQILLGRGLMPRYDWALDLIIFLLDNARLTFIGLVAVSALLALILWRRSRRAAITGENPAEVRKGRSLMNSRIRWSRGYLALLFTGLLLLTVGSYYNNLEAELSPPLAVEVKDGRIALPLAMVGDGALHRFVYTSRAGVDIRYIVIKKSETAYGVGLDACDVCGAGGGYYERKGQVVCILCDVVMNKSTIGFAGGCNPVPLPFRIGDGNLIIDLEDLEAEESRFL